MESHMKVLLGHVDGEEPQFCAVSGKWVRGVHARTIYVGDSGYYYRVRNDALDDWSMELHEEIEQYVMTEVGNGCEH